MRKETENKLKTIQAHVKRNFKRWFKTYSNLEGVHVGLKKVGGKTLKNTYAVVFHVTKKKKRPAKEIPRSLFIQFKGKGKISVPTDVIGTGSTRLQGIKIGDNAKNRNSSLVGTIGFYFGPDQRPFLCSNMHVLAPNFLRNSILHYDVRRGSPPQNIELFDDFISANAQLIVAHFGDIDLGFALVDNPNVIERVFNSAGPPRGVLDLDFSNMRSVSLSFVGISSGLTNCNLITLGAVRRTMFPNIFITNLIKLERCTMDGDSGAPLFDERNRLAGIIIGRDEQASYAIHVNDVIDFFQRSNL